jgi:ribonuclease HII
VDPRYIPRVIYAGIDEAGYGPLLGPLCIGASAFSLPMPSSLLCRGEAPDLWSMLSAGVCRKPRDPKRRVAVDDSKKLKSAGKQPLLHLERGVLAFLADAVPRKDVPRLDGEYFAQVGLQFPVTRETPWNGVELPLPVAQSADDIAIARNLVARACAEAGCSLRALSVTALEAHAFNLLYLSLANKAHVNMALVFEALRHIDLMRGDEPALVAIDRQGGRMSYRDEIDQHVARGIPVQVIEETDTRSAYLIGDERESPLVVTFEGGAEERHLPVALASMAAKYTRELSMRRLNAYFADRLPGLKPTAGYVEDGRRFLAEVKPILARESISEHAFARTV